MSNKSDTQKGVITSSIQPEPADKWVKKYFFIIHKDLERQLMLNR